jgi:hypothetical protein
MDSHQRFAAGITIDSLLDWVQAYHALFPDYYLDQWDMFEKLCIEHVLDFFHNYPQYAAMPCFSQLGFRLRDSNQMYGTISARIFSEERLHSVDYLLLMQANLTACLQKNAAMGQLLRSAHKPVLESVHHELIDNRFHPSNVGRFRDWGY